MISLKHPSAADLAIIAAALEGRASRVHHAVELADVGVGQVEGLMVVKMVGGLTRCDAAKPPLPPPKSSTLKEERITFSLTSAFQCTRWKGVVMGKSASFGLAISILLPLATNPSIAMERACVIELAADNNGRSTDTDPTPSRPPYSAMSIYALSEVSGQLLVGTTSGLHRVDGDRLVTLSGQEGPIHTIQQVNGRILVGTSQGLARLDGDHLVAVGKHSGDHPVSVGNRPLAIWAIRPVGGEVLVGSTMGLLRLEGDELIPPRQRTHVGTVWSLEEIDGQVLVGSATGLYRVTADELVPLATDVGMVSPIQKIGGQTLVGASRGLFRLEGERLEPVDVRPAVGAVTSFRRIDSEVLVGSTKGLFRLVGGHLQEVMTAPSIERVNALQQISDRLWIGSTQGLFQYTNEPFRALGPGTPLTFGTGTTAVLRFATSRCLSLIEPSRLVLVTDQAAQSPVVTPTLALPSNITVAREADLRGFYATIGPLQAGTWRVRLALRKDAGVEPVSDPVELRVDWTPADYATHYLRQAAPWLAGGHTLLFLLLLAGARHSPWCWRVLSDPVWGRLGLWWHAALRHVPALQRWVLARWFDRVRYRDRRPYLPVPLTAPDGEIVATATLFERLRTQPRLWVQGGAGMGKTTLVSDLARQFFAGHTSLRAAYGCYGFIPIVVRLRNGLDIKPDLNNPDRWLSELARKALRADGLRIDDIALFRAILESGRFVLILDGANEIANAQALVDYASTTPDIRFVVTSQADPTAPSDPEKPGFELLRLPATVEDMVGPLLSLFLGPERGKVVLEAVRSTPLWPEMISGYDVRLLADLAGRNGPVPELPEDRIGLYRALLSRLRYAGGPYPEVELSHAAWAMWRDGVRLFDDTKYLTPDLIEPLRQEDARVVRTIDGLYEFRHDQMRGYLAALWAARHAVAPARLFETDKAIWSRGFLEQDMVWNFFATLIDRAGGEALWQWCLDDPERAVLLHALDKRGRRDGWTLVRNAPE